MNHWIKKHKKKNRAYWKVELVFTDCESGVLIVDEVPYEDDFVFNAPFELILESVTLYDGIQEEVWCVQPMPSIHMTPPCDIRIDFTRLCTQLMAFV